MSYSSMTVDSSNPSYSGGGTVSDNEYNSTYVQFGMGFQGYPVSSLTESQMDDLFQDFLDYMAAYPGFVANSVAGTKLLGHGVQQVTPNP